MPSFLARWKCKWRKNWIDGSARLPRLLSLFDWFTGVGRTGCVFRACVNKRWKEKGEKKVRDGEQVDVLHFQINFPHARALVFSRTYIPDLLNFEDRNYSSFWNLYLFIQSPSRFSLLLHVVLSSLFLFFFLSLPSLPLLSFSPLEIVAQNQSPLVGDCNRHWSDDRTFGRTLIRQLKSGRNIVFK